MTHHLDHFTIDQFRGLRNLELRNLGQVNLFVGTNNSGKTSVLEAIATFSRPFDPVEWLSTSRRRDTVGGITSIARLTSLRWLFPQTLDQGADDIYHGTAQMHASGAFQVKSVSAQYQEIRGVPDEVTLRRIQTRLPGREPDETYQGAELRVEISVALHDLFTEAGPLRQEEANFIFWESAPFFSRQKPPEKYSLPVITLTPVTHRAERAQIERYSKIAVNREIEDVLELIRQFDSDIIGLQIIDRGGTSLYVDHRKTGLTPLSAFGDGVRRVVMIALTLPQAKNGILLIDEIETAIHSSVLESVCRWLFTACEQYNTQLFATTHSLEALDAMLIAQVDSPDRLAAYRLGQSGEPVRHYSGELLDRLRGERGLDVR